MGRLKMFGKGSKKPAETPATSTTAAPTTESETAVSVTFFLEHLHPSDFRYVL